MQKNMGIVIDTDGCELEVWLTYRDQDKTDPEHVHIVFDGHTIGDFPYKMPDNDQVCQAADAIARGHTPEIDLRVDRSATQTIDHNDDEVLEPFQDHNPPALLSDHDLTIKVDFVYNSCRYVVRYQHGKITIWHGAVKVSEPFGINEAQTSQEILAQAAIAPYVQKLVNRVRDGRQTDERYL